MATYLIGDVHGCYDELVALLHQVDFNSQKDTLWLTGDLVARGPGSLDVLRYVKSLGDSVRLVLGNHDLHLLAVFAGISRNKPKDRVTSLLEAPDADELLNWLRRQPLLQVDEEKKLVMAHAGITPQWDLQTAKDCARDVEAVLSSDSYPFFLDAMYGDMPNNWTPELTGLARLRFITNAFTRMRYCFPNGQLDMYSKESPEDAPAPLKPWFAILDLSVKCTALHSGTGHRWKAKAHQKVFTRWIRGVAGEAISPVCAGKTNSTLCSHQIAI